MSPEAPGNLVVLNLSFQGDELTGTVERVSPSQEGLSQGALKVRFDARTNEQGFYSVGNGVAWVSQPTNYVQSPCERAGKIPSPGGLQFYYNHVAYGDGLMLILILPKGYTLSESDPVPRGVKEFRGRIALYFKPTGQFGDETRVAWKLKKVEGSTKEELKHLHARVLSFGKTPSHPGVVVDDEDPQMSKDLPSAWDYGRMSLIALLIGIGLLVLYIYKVSSLPPGVQNRVYFIILLPSALSCSIALFGILRSKAHIRYKHLGTMVELSGAAALFALIVYFGSTVQGADSFDLTVRVHSAEEPTITSGTITLDLGSDRRVEAIDAKGEANFKRIPPEFGQANVKMWPKVDGYEDKPQDCGITRSTMGNVADITLVKAHYETVLRGSVSPWPAGKELIVKVEGQDGETTVDKYGEFKLPVKGKDGDRVRVHVFSNGELIYDDYQVLPGPAPLQLHK